MILKKFGMFIILLVSAVTVKNVTAQTNSKYEGAMMKLVSQLDSARTDSVYISLGNGFQRIANAEKKEWLPSYYMAFCKIMLAARIKDDTQVDALLDDASSYLDNAMAIEKDNSEIVTLKAFLDAIRMRVNPQERWQTYGAESQKNIAKAKALDPTNPRPYLLQGQGVLYMPAAFGGGKANAEPILKQASERFSNFKPKSPIHPNWGKAYCEQLLAQ
jgi:hypothetical protein